MNRPFDIELEVDAFLDFVATLTAFSSTWAQLALSGATATLALRVTSLDPTPLVEVTTTAGASGSLSFGAAFPSPAGLLATNAEALEQLGPAASCSTTVPPPAVIVTSVAGLATQPPEDTAIGTIAFVEASGGAFYAWSPDDPSTPTGTTIVAGEGGNWLLYGTLLIDLTATALAALVGYDHVVGDIVVTWGNGQQTKLVELHVRVRQTDA